MIEAALVLGGGIGGFLAGVLKSALTNRATAWLTPSPPDVKGKRAAFELFQTLERLEFGMEEFAGSLQRLITASEASAGSDKEERCLTACIDVHATLRAVLDELGAIDHLLRRVLGPALSIHRPDIIDAITKMSFDRSQALPVGDPLAALMDSDECRRAFAALASASVPVLRSRLAVVRENQGELVATIQSLRELLAKEFAFKDSFV